jgi:hypothetical protein
MWSEIFIFILAVLSHWQSYVTGGAVTGIVFFIERVFDWKMPKWAFIAVFGVVFLLVSFFLAWQEQYREALKIPALQQQVQDQAKQITELKEKPAQVQVNVPAPVVNVPSQMAYMSTNDTVAVVKETYKLGGQLAVTSWCKNGSMSAIAENAACQTGVRIAEAKPNPNQIPFVMQPIQERLYRDFRKEIAPFKPQQRTYAPGESTIQTVGTPMIDEQLDKAFRTGSKTIMFFQRNTWEDALGKHESEACLWLQFEPRMFAGPGVLASNAQVVWQYCANHNGPHK